MRQSHSVIIVAAWRGGFDNIQLDSGRLDMVYPALGGSFWEVEKNRREHSPH